MRRTLTIHTANWFGLFVGLLVAAPCSAAEPWDAPAFSGKPADMLKAIAGREKPEDADIEILLEDVSYVFDVEGRKELTVRRTYRLLTEDGVDNYAALERIWSPWCEEKPALRARVITPDGEAHDLDPKSIGEVPVEQVSPNVWSDRRVASAPLPAVCVGAIVETEFVVRETAPWFEQGIVRQCVLARFNPTRKLRLTIDRPVDLPFRYEVIGLDLTRAETKTDQRVSITFERGPIEAIRTLEDFLPPDVSQFPTLIFSTGKSWQDIATGYATIVDRQIDAKDVEPIAKGIIAKETDRRKIVDLLLDNVHQYVRYTGVEFGQAAIQPRTPRETLTRRYGDCKDQATLLVAMLRAVGIEAHVALLQTGPGYDVRPTLPGLGMFNHAIVFVPGDSPIWIDPTDQFLPAGTLPSCDQGRWALVANAASKKLVRTPRAASADNTYTELREIDLNYSGTATVRETLTFSCGLAGDSRQSYATQSVKELRRMWKDYATSAYATDSIARLEYGSPRDLAKPFTVTVEIEDATCGSFDDVQATVVLQPTEVFDRLPDVFKTLPPEEDEGDSSDDSGDDPDARGARRKHPLLLSEPHVCEVQCRITAPVGYVPRKLPEDLLERFGPATIRRQFHRKGESTVVAVFRLDTGTGQFTVEQFEQMRDYVCGLGSGEGPSQWTVEVAFEQVAGKLLVEEKVKEALKEYGRLLEKHADLAGLRAQYSRALLGAGMGEAARNEARRAVKAAPESAEIRANLARVFIHDLLGQPFRFGIDWQGAEEAYRQALEIEPDNCPIRVDYAILHEHNENGQRYAQDAKMDRAIDEYRKVCKQYPDFPGWAYNLTAVLWHSGKVEEVRKLAERFKGVSVQWQAMLAASVAVSEGNQSLLRQVRELADSPQQRQSLMATTLHVLSQARHYREVAQGSRAAAEDNLIDEKTQAGLEVIAKMKRIEEAALPEEDPCRCVQRFFTSFVVAGTVGSPERDMFFGEVADADLDHELQCLPLQLRRLVVTMFARAVPPLRIADGVSLFEFSSEGTDATGYVVTASLDNSSTRWYVVNDEGTYRLLARGPAHANLGSAAMRCLDEKNVAGAQAWLDRIWQEHKSEVRWLDRFSSTPSVQLWRSLKHDDSENVRLCAAAAIAIGNDPQEAIPILEKALKRDLSSWQAFQVSRALIQAYRTAKQPKRVVETMGGVLDKYDNATLLGSKLMALVELERDDEVRKIVRERQEKKGLSRLHAEMLVSILGEIGDISESVKSLRKLAEQDELSFAGLNNLAWSMLFLPDFDEDALKYVTRSMKAAPGSRLETLNTLAAVHAELGNTAEALRTLRLRVGMQRGRLVSGDFYVLGRIAEQYGLSDVAADYYRAVTPPGRRSATSCRHLAQQRLEAMEQQAREASGARQ